MRKVSILTLNGYSNYGNRLQLFALSRNIERLGYNANIFWRKRNENKMKDLIKYRFPFRIIFKKEAKIKKFSDDYLPKISNSTAADYFIVGSDQVWNPGLFDGQPWLLGDGVDGRKIAYAASIGREKLSKEQLKLFEQKLKRFSAISVREQSAKKLLQPLTDKKVEVVLDPTLLLDTEEYKSLEKRPKDIKADEKYILCYILGNHDYQNMIDEFAKKNRCKVILFSDKHDSSYGIEEFLYLIHHAELICTDSFHACVFSFIFEKPFLAFRRTGKENYMYTRLKNLIETFKLRNREFNGKEITKENLTVDYVGAKKILIKERQKSLAFLTKALGVKNEG